LRGVEAELDGGLEGGLSEVSEEVADLLLAGVDDLTGGGTVDGRSHPLTKLLEAAAQLFHEGVGGQGRFDGHGLLLLHKANGYRARLRRPSFPPQFRRSRKICHTLAETP
jgi:hypothetical protein